MDKPTLKKLFELMILVSRKTELGLAIAEKFALNRRSDSAHSLGLHKSEEHRRFFNSDYSLQCQREYEEELRQLRNQYEQISVEIGQLQAELEGHLTATAA